MTITQEMIQARPAPFVGMRVWAGNQWRTLDNHVVGLIRAHGWDAWRKDTLLPGEPGCPPDPELEGYVPRVGDEWMIRTSMGEWYGQPKAVPLAFYQCTGGMRLYTRGGPNNIGGIYPVEQAVATFKIGDMVRVDMPNTPYDGTVGKVLGEDGPRRIWVTAGDNRISVANVFIRPYGKSETKRPEILDRAELARQNNTRDTCVSCNSPLKIVQGFASEYRVCSRCEG